MSHRTRVKVCCISSPREAQMAIDAGADALGLVGNMPSGPGVISDSEIRTIARGIAPPIATFLLTSETSVDGVIAHYQKVNTSVIQLVDALPHGAHADIRNALPGVKLVQVIHVTDDRSVEEAKKLASEVDALLLDSGNPHAEVKELGGTGRTHNWDLSRRIVQEVPIPVFLAGGLNPSNVREAIQKVRPYGLDLCSGIRTDGQLDPEKLMAFMEVVSRA